MADEKKNLLLLFNRSKRSGEMMSSIRVESSNMPDLMVPRQMNVKDNFSLFMPRHQKMAAALTDIFMKAQDVTQFQEYATFARDQVNPQLFNYALSAALLHRSDTKDMNMSLLVESFPSKFFDTRPFIQQRFEDSDNSNDDPQSSRLPIMIPRENTASNLEPEHALWYFREDLGINLHHWHWHLVYPAMASDISMVKKDRRGELFYYMHQQILARYNFERFSNNLPQVTRLDDFRAVIPEGYFPKLDSAFTNGPWPSRISNAYLRDINRRLDQIDLKIETLEGWHNEIRKAIDQGFVIDEKGQKQELDENTGIDILGNIIESSQLSPNTDLYGDYHNRGHVLISYQHDPDGRHLESFAVMGDTATAMRDPIFYRWHSQIDDLFDQHKRKLNPYTEQELKFDDIQVKEIKVQTVTGRENTFNTYWQESKVNIGKGLKLGKQEDAFVEFTHLQHNRYSINIEVNNESIEMKMGMARVFFCPKYDENGVELNFNKKRRMMVELDKFVIKINPGLNNFRRRSTDSTVIIPFERTFSSFNGNDFCGCGWPEHMLIPRGNPQGLAAELFVMISDYSQDRVDQNVEGPCNDAASYCGIRDKLYPDRKPMGFPFDRIVREEALSLNEFLTPNMGKIDVTIKFNDRVVTQSHNRQ